MRFGKFGALGVQLVQQSFGGDERLRGAKSPWHKESRREYTGSVSTREGASTRASVKRDASLGVEATLTDGQSHKNVKMCKLRFNLAKEDFYEMTFPEHGVTMDPEEGKISGDKGHVPFCSKEEMQLTWMRDTRIRLFMKMELMSCMNELDWLIRYYHCAVDNYPEAYFSPMPLPVLPKFV